ncbi:hypothetical protein [Megalodesulfovibrio paquesii]
MTAIRALALLAMALWLGTLGTQGALAKPVRWCVQDIPPFFIQTGLFRRQGVLDHLLADLAARDPALFGATQDSPIARCMEEMRHSEGLCHLSLVKTPEREQFAIFSEPMLRFLPPRVLIACNQVKLYAAFLTQDGFDLEAFLRAPGELKLVIIRGRRYGEVVDDLLAKHAESPGLYVVPTATSPFAMLMAGRVGAAIGHPVEAGYYTQIMQENGETSDRPRRMKSFPIVRYSQNREGQPVHETPIGNLSYVACSKTPTGEAVIGRVNELLQDGNLTLRMATEYARWLDRNGQRDFWAVQGAALRAMAPLNTPAAPPPSAPAH